MAIDAALYALNESIASHLQYKTSQARCGGTHLSFHTSLEMEVGWSRVQDYPRLRNLRPAWAVCNFVLKKKKIQNPKTTKHTKITLKPNWDYFTDFLCSFCAWVAWMSARVQMWLLLHMVFQMQSVNTVMLPEHTVLSLYKSRVRTERTKRQPINELIRIPGYICCCLGSIIMRIVPNIRVLKSNFQSWACWSRPVVPATWETEARGSKVQVHLRYRASSKIAWVT